MLYQLYQLFNFIQTSIIFLNNLNATTIKTLTDILLICTEVWGYKLYKYSWDISYLLFKQRLHLPLLLTKQTLDISQHFQLQSPQAEPSERCCDCDESTIPVSSRCLWFPQWWSSPWPCLWDVQTAWERGWGGGSDLHGCRSCGLLLVVQGVSKTGLVCGLTFILELQIWSTKYRGGRSGHWGNRNH